MGRMGAADFKAHCLRVMETVRRTRRPVTITKRGVPVVKVVPADPTTKFVLGALAGRLASRGDLVSSPLSDEEWMAIAEEGNAPGDRGTKTPAREGKRVAGGRRRR